MLLTKPATNNQSKKINKVCFIINYFYLIINTHKILLIKQDLVSIATSETSDRDVIFFCFCAIS